MKQYSYREINEINKSLKTTDIKGKSYVEVNERIKGFRKLFPNGTISTEIVSLEGGICVIKATALDEEGHILGTGHSYERENSNLINKTSYIENCETSAVGRCLGMMGIGIDTSIASYEEVATAIQNQTHQQTATPSRQKLKEFCEANNLDGRKVAQKYGLHRESTEEDFKQVLTLLSQGG